MLLTFIKLPFVIKTSVLSIFEWPFYTGFTVVRFIFTLCRFYQHQEDPGPFTGSDQSVQYLCVGGERST